METHADTPYRSPAAGISTSACSAPPLEWSRPVAFGLTLIGALLTLPTLVVLLTDDPCPGEAPEPHPGAAVLLLASVVVVSALSIATHRWLLATLRRHLRARGRVARIATGAVLLLPAALAIAADAGLAVTFALEYVFHLCFSAPLFSFGC